MDKSASVQTYKRRQKLKGQSNEKSEDGISNLPDHILHYILSFLPTKYVFRTSVLSKRWKGLWTSVHNLTFSDKLLHSATPTQPFLERRKRIFTDFVNRVLLLSDVPILHSFKFACDANICDATQFKEWMSIVLRRQVQELVVCITSLKDWNYLFPLFRLPSESLKILKCDMKASIELPSSKCLSSLKVLHLTKIAFSSRRPIQHLFLDFPFLEEFVMECCELHGMKTVNISAPILKVLDITDWCIRRSVEDLEIKIHSESILSLSLRCLFFTYSLHNPSSVVKANIELYSSNPTRGKDDHRLGTLLRGISNVKELNLSTNIIKVFFYPDISSHLIPFLDLTHLGLKGYNKRTASDVSGRHFVDLLLHNMPNIESLRFPWGLDSLRFKGQGRMIGTTPESFLSHLKIVDIGMYSGTQSVIWVLKFLIKSARVIDKLTIKVGYDISINRRSNEARMEKVRNEFETLARDMHCITEFTLQDYIKDVPSWK